MMVETKRAKRAGVIAKASKGKGFTDAEKSAMKERVKELQSGKAEGEEAVLEKIAEMQAPDRALAARLHSIIKSSAPVLEPKLWYGMPAYALAGGKIVCFFQPATKFKTRYATFAFNDTAKLDDGSMWPVGYALMKLTATEEARIAALLKKAVG